MEHYTSAMLHRATYSQVSMSLVTGMRSVVSQDGKRTTEALKLQRRHQPTVKKPRNARQHIKISPGSNTCLDAVERSVSTKLYCISNAVFLYALFLSSKRYEKNTKRMPWICTECITPVDLSSRCWRQYALRNTAENIYPLTTTSPFCICLHW